MNFDNLCLKITKTSLNNNTYVPYFKKYNLENDICVDDGNDNNIVDNNSDILNIDEHQILQIIIYAGDINNIIFSKILIPNSNYIPEYKVLNFINNDKPLEINNFQDGNIDIIQFHNNYLVFKYAVVGNTTDTMQHIIFNLSNQQLIQFKSEFKNIIYINNILNIDVPNDMQNI